jgi:hypothetical protein
LDKLLLLLRLLITVDLGVAIDDLLRLGGLRLLL